MHDILEGVLQYEVKLLLHHLVTEERLFTLEQLNKRLQTFDYGYNAAKDKPSAYKRVPHSVHRKQFTGAVR
jgi:hypothetical protein